ncbi:Hpt domain-containing protein [Flavobacterium sp. MC2016-06]|jgi:HPt (histidine-containing phosphotransfer) domain-containing protein|uniref:Hpt domain-containing protein n=1 Tax=Flavobacterium sp. MC2016-06 TaxID=2676308 RepID=UPI0012BA9114|nr:Hpt domain-containing protein [Flavobacterium sp. MC2016-06]MBU3857697.1 Hpt domain-containing protein [Flavobacterium sp. MC2016-06]
MEQPNLTYIDQISGDDDEFKKKIITIIQKELPLEIAAYHKSLESQNYKNAAEYVHKLKHKISIFGLEKGYDITNEYETDLFNGIIKSPNEFESILQLIQRFVNSL